MPFINLIFFSLYDNTNTIEAKSIDAMVTLISKFDINPSCHKLHEKGYNKYIPLFISIKSKSNI